MTVRLKCAATADLVLLSATASQLLGLLGKSSLQPGILTVEEMPAALALLNRVHDAPQGTYAPAGPPASDVAAYADDPERPGFADETVSLRQRVWPLIRMIEEALHAGRPIVWGG